MRLIGPGEAREADIGIAGGIKEGLLFKKGEIIRKIKQEDMVEELKQEISNMIEEKRKREKVIKITVGRTAGFCYGVRRAVEGAIKKAKQTKEPIYCLGEIVHNRQVIEKLEDLGIKFVETIEEVKEGMVLIRAHGVSKEIYQTARKMNLTIQDYTCPSVIKVHKIAEKFSQKGYFVFLLGIENHPENIGTISYCGNDYYVFNAKEELEEAMKAFKESKKKKLLLIAQTTFNLRKFYEIEERIQKQLEKDIFFVAKNTICRSTEIRQKETDKLSKKVDSMIIVGGKNSSNTKKLYEIAKKNCENTILVETVRDLKEKEMEGKVGIMAGASTPQESIEEIKRNLI